MPLPVVAVIMWQLVLAVGRWVVASGIGWAFVKSSYDGAISEIADAWHGDEIGTLTHQIDLTIIRLINHHLNVGLAETSPFSVSNWAMAMTTKAGIPLRDIFDRDVLREDLESYALDRLQAATGYRLSSLTDDAAVRRDVESIALAMIERKTGLPLSVAVSEIGTDPNHIRSKLVDWCAPIVVERILSGADDVSKASMMAELRRRSGNQGLSPDKLAQRINDAAAAVAMSALAQLPRHEQSKATRRKLQLREGQRKFRAAHGRRDQYVPVGYVATIAKDGDG
jgi:hypothetical protein